jgi:peptidoglycan/xylan/chitin deacetylase (PgdA/CDA1 family)
VLIDEEICQLVNRPGHSIGAHTVHHLALTTQPVETKRHEVLADKAALEGILAKPVRLFSYPYGDVDAELLSVVRAAGFLAAVTVEAGVVRAGANRLLLPRYEVAASEHENFPQFLRDLFV